MVMMDHNVIAELEESAWGPLFEMLAPSTQSLDLSGEELFT